MEIINGDSLVELCTFPDNYFDSVVTDPPYGLAFMNKHWDYDVPSVELWREVLRVLKPGGHLLSFGGTRTYHRMVVAIEDAGFEIRDQVQWIYGSGFPKSQDVSKAIDKQAGAERTEVIGEKSPPDGRTNANRQGNGWVQAGFAENKKVENNTALLAPATDEAKRWQGWGTALKPANEPIVLARKPLAKGLTVAANVLKHGTGAINVDASRIGYASEADKKNNTEALARFNSTSGNSGAFMASDSIKPNLSGTAQGRWPANVLFDEEAAAVLDEQSGNLGKSAGGNSRNVGNKVYGKYAAELDRKPCGFGDSGGASRFFYVAKAGKRERNAGLEGMPERVCGVNQSSLDGGQMLTGSGNVRSNTKQNHHPTVKPIKLMEYLVRMITPPGGCVLDPFAGSGSTGVACKNLKFKFVGIEREKQYAKIAQKRIGL